MTVTETEFTTRSGSANVVEWRFQQLARVGYPADEALVVAHHVEVDLHEAVELVGRGCPPQLAVRILL